MDPSTEASGTPEPEDERRSRERAGEAVETADPAEGLRGELFMGLDRLAFALEMEAAEAVEAGDEEEALRIEHQRLGVRLAQRFVAGVYADEVDPRIWNAGDAYDRRTASRPLSE